MSNTITFEEFDVSESDGISLRWTKWYHKVSKYIAKQNFDDETEKLHIDELFMHGGYDLEQVYTQYKEEGDKLEQVVKKIADHFNPPGNIHLNRFKFHDVAQMEGESFDEYTTRVKASAKLCAFTSPDDEIVSQIIQRCRSATLKDKALSRATTPTLKEMVAMGRLDESIQAQIKEIPPSATSNINNINTDQYRPHHDNRSHHSSRFSKPGHQHSQEARQNAKCPNCAYDLPHKTRDGECPAKGRECTNCGKMNHFKQACRQKTRNNHKDSRSNPQSNNPGYNRSYHQDRSNRRVHYLNQREQSSEDECDENGRRVWSISNVIHKTKAYVNSIFMPTVILMLLQTAIRFNIDTGSQVDLMDLDTFKRIKNSPRLKKCNTTLYGYNSRVPLEVEGEFTTRVQYGNNQYRSVKFIVTTGKARQAAYSATQHQ